MAGQVNIRDIRDELIRRLRGISGVGAVGVSWTASGERCLRVNVEPGFTQRERIPASIHGVPVRVQTAAVGHLTAL